VEGEVPVTAAKVWFVDPPRLCRLASRCTLPADQENGISYSRKSEQCKYGEAPGLWLKSG